MAPSDDSGDWLEHKKFIIESLRSTGQEVQGLKADIKDLKKYIDEKFLTLSVDMATSRAELKQSARAWALVAGAVCTFLMTALWKFLD